MNISLTDLIRVIGSNIKNGSISTQATKSIVKNLDSAQNIAKLPKFVWKVLYKKQGKHPELFEHLAVTVQKTNGGYKLLRAAINNNTVTIDNSELYSLGREKPAITGNSNIYEEMACEDDDGSVYSTANETQTNKNNKNHSITLTTVKDETVIIDNSDLYNIADDEVEYTKVNKQPKHLINNESNQLYSNVKTTGQNGKGPTIPAKSQIDTNVPNPIPKPVRTNPDKLTVKELTARIESQLEDKASRTPRK